MAAPLEIHAWEPGDPAAPEAFPPDAAFAARDEASWDWAFRRNPAGTRLFLARRAGHVVARYAALPVRTRVLGETRTFASLLGSWSSAGDEARRATAQAFLEAHGGPQGDLVHYGWPDAMDLAFGRSELEHELLRTGSLFERALGPGPASVASPVRVLERFGAEADVLHACCATHWNASAVRDAVFLNWRFLEHPWQRYRVLGFASGATLRGYAVVRLAPELSAGFAAGLALLMDWLVLPGDDEASAALLAAALAEARAQGAVALATSVPEWSPWAQFFQAHGFRHRPSEHLEVVRASVPRFDMLWLRDNWWSTLADVLHL